MKSMFLLVFLLAYKPVYAGGKHEHGIAYLSLAPKGSEMNIRLDSAADNIVGFEYEPKTDEQKLKVSNAKESLTTKISELLVLPTSLGCQWTTDSFEVTTEHHRHYYVQWTVKCSQSLKDQTLQVLLGKAFPRIHELRVSLLQEEGQHQMKLKRAKGEIKL